MTKPCLRDQSFALLETDSFKPAQRLRLLGRYGPQATHNLITSNPSERIAIETTPYLWAELRQAACCEGVVHLDDLLLRRVRLGLLLPNGGLDVINRIRETVQSVLDWDETRWEQEIIDYAQLWQTAYQGKR